MGADLIAELVFLVGVPALAGAVFYGAKLYSGARLRLVRNPRPPRGSVRRIRGTVAALAPIRSPIDNALGVLAYTRIAPRPGKLFAGGPRAEITTANDFVVKTPDGPFVVRACDLWVRDLGPPSGVLHAFRIPEAVAEAIRAAGLDPRAELYYRELVVFPGQEVTVVVVVKDELPPQELRDTYREGELIPTLSGGGGAVQVEPVRIPVVT
jgi:hypothetical protein